MYGDHLKHDKFKIKLRIELLPSILRLLNFYWCFIDVDEPDIAPDINYSDDMQNDPNMVNTNKKLDRLQKKDSR